MVYERKYNTANIISAKTEKASEKMAKTGKNEFSINDTKAVTQIRQFFKR